MRKSRLVFVEGLPGSGKSTTARYIGSRLQRAHAAVRLFAEVEPDHPLNVGGPLHPAGATTGEELFQCYTVEAYVAESLERWRAFVGRASAVEAVNVLDSYPYQNASRVLLQMDSSLDVIRRHARAVEDLARPLTPVVVYIESTPNPEALTALTRARGEAWTAYAIEVLTSCPYARHRELSGAAGATAMLSAYHEVVQLLLRASTLPRLELDACAGNWPGCYQRIDDFLAL
jgi:thymidylate kinase